MRLVDHHRVVLGQRRTAVHGVDGQQRVVGDHQVGRPGLLPGLLDEAVVAVRAALRARGTPGPGSRPAARPGRCGSGASSRSASPRSSLLLGPLAQAEHLRAERRLGAADAAEMVASSLRAEIRAALVLRGSPSRDPEQAGVVGPPLEDRVLGPLAGHLLHRVQRRRDVLGGELASAAPASRWRPRSARGRARPAGPAPAPGSPATCPSRSRPGPAGAARCRGRRRPHRPSRAGPAAPRPPISATAAADARCRGCSSAGTRAGRGPRSDGLSAHLGTRSAEARTARPSPARRTLVRASSPARSGWTRAVISVPCLGVLHHDQLTGAVDPVDEVAPVVRDQRADLDLRTGQTCLDPGAARRSRGRCGPRRSTAPGYCVRSAVSRSRPPGRPC